MTEIITNSPRRLRTLECLQMLSVKINDRDRCARNILALSGCLAKHSFRLFQADDAVVHVLR